MWSHVILSKVGLHAQKCHQYDKTIIDGCITTYIYSYLSIYPVIYKALLRVSTTIRFILHEIFFLYFLINISQIYQISTIQTKIRAYNFKQFVTACFDIQSWIILFISFGYLPGLYFFLVCGDFPLTSKTESCRNLLNDASRLNQIHPIKNIISCPIQNLTRNTTWRIIWKMS